MKHEYINWSCKLFEGFYESSLYNSDTLYYINKENEDGKEYDIDFESFTKEVGEKAAELLHEEVSANGVIHNIDFKEIDSPEYYNFTTDKLVLDIDFDENALDEYILEDVEAFDEYLHDTFTSYDGFISFVPNNWKEFKDWEDKRQIDIKLEYYLLNEVDLEKYSMDLAEYAYEAVYDNLIEVEG